MDRNLTRKGRKAGRRRTGIKITDIFTAICRADLKVECVKEYKFHPTRRWRFDYAIPEHKIAIEIDGGVWTYGRHNRAGGYIADMEKFNAAAALGWVVLKFTPQEQYAKKTFELIRKTMETVKNGNNPVADGGAQGG